MRRIGGGYKPERAAVSRRAFRDCRTAGLPAERRDADPEFFRCMAAPKMLGKAERADKIGITPENE
jgi:hypothetical protein